MTDKEAIENFKEQIKCLKCENGIDCEKCRPNWSIENDIEALGIGIEALEQERSRSAEITQYRYDCEKLMEENERLKKALEQESCEDCISRQAVIDALNKTSGIRGDALKALYELPPVTPQPKMGRWIVYAELTGEWEGTKKYACDKCGEKVGVFKSNYCPNCGAKIEGE